MTTTQLISPEFTGMDDLTLAEVDTKLKEHQQLLQVLLQSPGSILSYLPQNDAATKQTRSFRSQRLNNFFSRL